VTEPADSSFAIRMGDFFDRLGQPRIAGMLFGYLLICEPPEQSAAQLQRAVAASSGSVSTMLRLLQGVGFVERRGETGGRRLWYRVAPGAFSRVLTLRMQLVTELRKLAEIGLAETESQAGLGERLREMRDCYAFFEKEFPALMERYQTEIGDQE
jgi:DNA-binding transcriptional regulator GbsR (MarR family)